MHNLRWKVIPAFGTVLTVGLTLILAARAHEGHKHDKPVHGGIVATTKHHQFELVLRKDGLNVYAAGDKNDPIDATRLSGTVTFTLPGVSKPFTYQLRAAAPRADRTPDSLGLVIDLSKVPAKGSTVAVQISGLANPVEPTAGFTVPFALPEAVAITFTKATKADEKAIAAQKVCKVSGEDLGAMGTPIKATRGDRSTFLCCPACEQKLQSNPDKYLVAAISMSKATKADQRAIDAQKTCPVSGEALTSMGTPIKVTRGDRSVFLCCPACLEKVEADPDKFLGTAVAPSAKEKHDHAH
jgi:YHS domain-containing protein